MVARRNRAVTVLTGVLALVVVPALAAPASAGATTTGVTARPTGTAGTLSPGEAASRITLITGDVVEVTPAGDGRFAAAIRPGPGREDITFHTIEADGGLRLLPSDVVPYVSSGVLDADLFDVEELIADGYSDAATSSLPLIVRYQETGATGARALAGTRTVRELRSVGGAAVSADKAGLAEFWRSVRPAEASAQSGPNSGLGGGIAQIWLDGRVRAALDHSVPQIGAPEAWQAGYDGRGVDVAVLDTGIDPSHPDLAGRIEAAENFTDSPDARDRNGHGTHVAATIAGSGAASGGTRKGVAPGADLLVGKVLNDEGYGYESWIIAGMEWAAAAGAEVVNMSLGGGATDGTDPLSEAVDRLTAETGTLFVVAAGNEGTEWSVGTPGAATSALTVGAVDRDDNLADFSSRGPRLGDLAVKPEITAPGVGIVAARAGGTSLGTPVDEHYTRASGTSMATPHVAGAAALLAQANPGWRAPQLKDALVSTARTHPDQTVYQQGAGRLDVARAVTQGVYGTGVLNLGRHEEPAGAPSTHTLTYTNGTDADVTLDLAVSLRNVDTGAQDSDAVALGSTRLTVPARQTASVPVTLTPGELSRGRHSGWISATGPDGLVIRTAIGTALDGPRHTVTFRATDRRGEHTSVPVILLLGEDYRSDGLAWLPPWSDKISIEVEEGTYVLNAIIEDGGPLDVQATFITNPELRITQDMEILLDARTGTPIRIETPKPAEQQAIISYYEHRRHANGRVTSHGIMHFSTVQQVNVTPTQPVSQGEYEFSSRWQLVAPMVQAEVKGVDGPLDINLLHQSPTYEGRRRFPLVPAGTGTPEELAAAPVTGAAALVTAVEERSEQEQIAAAAAAGAAVAIIVRPADMSPWTVWRPIGDREPIPALVVAHDDGQRLLARATAGKATIDLTLTVSSPYLYDVFHVERDRVPERIVHRVTRNNTTQITTRYAETGGFGWAKEQRFGWRPWQEYSWMDTQRIVATPSQREEWVSAGDSVWQHRVQYYYSWDDMNPLTGGMTEAPRSYEPKTRRVEEWFTPVVRPAAVPWAPSQRTGDTLALRVPEFVDSVRGHYQRAEWEDQVTARLWRDGVLLAELPDAVQDVTTTAGDAAYRLELTTARGGEEWRWATRTETVWEFRSGRPASDETAPLPLLQVDYDAPTDLDGWAPASHPHFLKLNLWHYDGLPAPTGTAVRVEYSFDEGASWQTAQVVNAGGTFRAKIPAGTGRVSLRVHARDAAGNAVTQTVIRAYGLR